MIQRVDFFTLDNADVENTAKSTMIAGGRALGRVRGSHIDAQFAVDDGHVLFISFDHMFSAIETIYFVDARSHIRDQVKLGHAMEQGLISDIEIEGADRIRFAFPLTEPHVVRIAHETSLFGLRHRWLHLDS